MHDVHRPVRAGLHLRWVTRRALMLAASVGLVAGCGTLDRINEANRIDYKSSGVNRRAALDVPPDLSAPRADERFAIPARGAGAAGSGASVSGAPGTATTLSEYQRGQTATATQRTTESPVAASAPGARMERAGTQRWLVVDQPPAKLWPLVRDFWAENGFTLAMERPELGIVETDWAENRAKLPQDILRRTVGRVISGLYDTNERDKFRTRLEPRTDGGTEIYLSHRGAEEIVVDVRQDRTRWQMRPSDPELEAEFMRRLLVKLGTEQERAQQVVAQGASAQPARARLTTDALEVDEGFDRAWRRVGLALDKAGFTVEDRDRSKGVFFVRYADVEGNAVSPRKAGILDRMLGRSDPTADARRYQIRVQGAGDGSQVQVLDREGRATEGRDDKRIATRILSLLEEQLR